MFHTTEFAEQTLKIWVIHGVSDSCKKAPKPAFALLTHPHRNQKSTRVKAQRLSAIFLNSEASASFSVAVFHPHPPVDISAIHHHFIHALNYVVLYKATFLALTTLFFHIMTKKGLLDFFCKRK